jgi:hypothetical protein
VEVHRSKDEFSLFYIYISNKEVNKFPTSDSNIYKLSD